MFKKVANIHNNDIMKKCVYVNLYFRKPAIRFTNTNGFSDQLKKITIVLILHKHYNLH